MPGDGIAIRRGGDDAHHAAMLLEPLEVVVAESDHLAPGHQAAEADRRPLEPDPDIGAPAFRLGNVDQDRLIRQRLAEQRFQPAGHAELDRPAPRRGVIERADAGIEIGCLGADLDRALVDLAPVERIRQAARGFRHAEAQHQRQQRGVVVVGQLARR